MSEKKTLNRSPGNRFPLIRIVGSEPFCQPSYSKSLGVEMFQRFQRWTINDSPKYQIKTQYLGLATLSMAIKY